MKLEMKEWFGPTLDCASGASCEGCYRCMRVAQLVDSVRRGDSYAACELANRVEKLLAPRTDCEPGTAADWIRRTLEPTPVAFLDALSAATEAFG